MHSQALIRSSDAQGMGKRNDLARPENQSLQSTLVRDWYWGTEQFKEVLMSRADRKAVKRNRNYQTSQMGRDHAQEEAEKLIRIGLKKYKLQEKHWTFCRAATSAK